VAAISQEIVKRGSTLLVTRASAETYEAVRALIPGSIYLEQAGLVTFRQEGRCTWRGNNPGHRGGHFRLPVAEEAACTAELMGNVVERLYDVGVAGLHRLLNERHQLSAARVIIVVAGMEGALPSVVSGLVSVARDCRSDSIGYGASFGGIAALLGMLNSCASGVSVVNIDNGFGAANIASLINHL
jgi:NCAIR mutase (PurE)-related protein